MKTTIYTRASNDIIMQLADNFFCDKICDEQSKAKHGKAIKINNTYSNHKVVIFENGNRILSFGEIDNLIDNFKTKTK